MISCYPISMLELNIEVGVCCLNGIYISQNRQRRADEGTLLLTRFVNEVGGVCTIQLFCLNLLAGAEYWLT